MIAPNRMSKSVRSGFTLTELLVVVAIIVVLAGVAVPITLNVLTEAKVDAARAQMKGTLIPAAKQYQLKNGTAPTSIMDLLNPIDGQGTLGTLPADAILDPWGNQYELTAVADDSGVNFSYTIASMGASPGDPSSRIEVSSR